jgi:hypothetical protein
MRTAIKTRSYIAASKQPAPQVVNNPKAAAFHNQPSHFAVWRLFVSRRVTLTTHGSSGCRAPLKWNGGDYASTPSGQTAARKFLWSEKISTLGHNLRLVSVLYFSERLENDLS